jgi:hypothetical protein
MSKFGLDCNFKAEENLVSCVHKPVSVISCKCQESRLRLTFACKDEPLPFAALLALVDYFTTKFIFPRLRMAPSVLVQVLLEVSICTQNDGR